MAGAGFGVSHVLLAENELVSQSVIQSVSFLLLC